MNNLYSKYFAGVRWVELALAFGVAVLGDLELTVQAGGRADRDSLLKALGVGAGVAWAYLRVPKDPGKEISGQSPSGEPLPEGIDATGPADDVDASVVHEVLTAVLTPAVGPAAANVAGNVLEELKKVQKRGIRWGGRWKL